jgi:hypothetical protein
MVTWKNFISDLNGLTNISEYNTRITRKCIRSFKFIHCYGFCNRKYIGRILVNIENIAEDILIKCKELN